MTTTSVTGVEVRDAGRSDLPAVRRVLLAAYREYATALPPAVFGRYLADILDIEARAADGRLLVAEHGGRVVGAVSFYAAAAAEGLGWPAGWAGLRALGVEPEARGLGIGRALVEACRRRAEADGVPVLCLHSAAFMTAALALYERMGFRRDPAYDLDAAGRLGLGVRPVPTLACRLDLSGRQLPEHGRHDRPAARVGEHVHPAAREAFTVVEGQLAVRRDGRDLTVGPGVRTEVPPGVAHDFWNATAEEVRVVVEAEPGERLAQAIRHVFLAAQDGRTDARAGCGRWRRP